MLNVSTSRENKAGQAISCEEDVKVCLFLNVDDRVVCSVVLQSPEIFRFGCDFVVRGAWRRVASVCYQTLISIDPLLHFSVQPVEMSLMNGNERYLIWDFDGTIAEREGQWSGALVDAAALHGYRTTREALGPFLKSGFPWHQPEIVRRPGQDASAWWSHLEAIFVKAYVEGEKLSPERASKMARSVRESYLASRHWRLYEDVRACLELLSSAGWRHLILSNHVPELESIVQSLGVSEYFDAIFTSGIIGVEKPNPNAFRVVQNYTGQNAELFMIGDSWFADVCGAINVGIKGILVRTEHEKARRYGRSLAEVPQLLNDL